MTSEQKALELVNAVRKTDELLTIHSVCYGYSTYGSCWNALCRAIEAHEADKARHAAELREQAERFSEFAQFVAEVYPNNGTLQTLAKPFILPPDPLAECFAEAMFKSDHKDERVEEFRKALEARGLAIVKKETTNEG